MAEKGPSTDEADGGCISTPKLYSVSDGQVPVGCASLHASSTGHSSTGRKGVTLTNTGFLSPLTIVNNLGSCLEVYCRSFPGHKPDDYSLAIKKHMDPYPKLSVFHIFRGDKMLATTKPDQYYVFEKTTQTTGSGGATTTTDTGTSAQQNEYCWLGRADCVHGVPPSTVGMLYRECDWPPVEICNSDGMAWFLVQELNRIEVYEKVQVPDAQKIIDAAFFPGKYLYGKLQSTESNHYLTYDSDSLEVTMTDDIDCAAYFRFGGPLT